MSKPVHSLYPHTALNYFVCTGRGGKAEEINNQEYESFKMLKMAVGKHHAAYNNITNYMDKNVTYRVRENKCYPFLNPISTKNFLDSRKISTPLEIR